MVIGKTIKLMDKDTIITRTEQNMKVTGTKTNNMDMVKKFGLMAPITKEVIFKARKMDRVHSTGLTGLHTLVNSKITILTGKELTHGLTNDNLPELGPITKCMDMVCLLGQTDENMKVNIKTTKKKVMGFLLGLMVVNTMANGSTESNMAMANIYQAPDKKKMVYGRMEKDSSG